MAKRKLCAALRQVENRTQRTVSIRPDAPTIRLRLAVNQQSASHFFKLPPELRLHIYELVFAPYNDESRPYATTAAHCRPGYSAHHRTDPAPLLTCRRIWLEANNLPLHLATHTFWFSSGPSSIQATVIQDAPDTEPYNAILRIPTEADRIRSLFKVLTPLSLTRLRHVHIFASHSWLSLNYLNDLVLQDNLPTKRLTITIRAGDWGLAKKLTPERVDLKWLDALLACPYLRDVDQLHLELEMKTKHFRRLCRIVDRIAAVDGKCFELCRKVQKTIWTRPSPDIDGESTSYTIITLRWSNVTAIAQFRRNQHGGKIMDSRLSDYNPAKHQTAKIGRKRGGRRASAVWYRNHWQEVRLTKEAERANIAAEVMQRWKREGSLLRLI